MSTSSVRLDSDERSPVPALIVLFVTLAGAIVIIGLSPWFKSYLGSIGNSKRTSAAIRAPAVPPVPVPVAPAAPPQPIVVTTEKIVTVPVADPAQAAALIEAQRNAESLTGEVGRLKEELEKTRRDARDANTRAITEQAKVLRERDDLQDKLSARPVVAQSDSVPASNPASSEPPKLESDLRRLFAVGGSSSVFPVSLGEKSPPYCFKTQIKPGKIKVSRKKGLFMDLRYGGVVMGEWVESPEPIPFDADVINIPNDVSAVRFFFKEGYSDSSEPLLIEVTE